MQHLLNYPQLFLFAYHLQESQYHNWQSLRERLQIPPEADSNSEQDYPFTINNIEGFYQRYPLGDTDSLFVGCSYQDEKPTDISCFDYFRQTIDAVGNIGKTWLILGYCDSNLEADQEQIAKNIYQVFKNTQHQPNLQQGKFIDSSLFAITTETEYILICLCPNRKNMEKIANFYYDLLYLFYYYHKITWTYKQTRIIKKSLIKEDFFPRASAIPDVKVSLPDLNLLDADFQSLKIALHQNIVTLAKHTTGLESLAIQLQTLKTNLNNYHKRLKSISQKANQETGNTQLDFLQKFGNFTATKYQNQIEQDYASLSPGLKVREKYIDTIRGIVEVSQAERDRRIETQNRKFHNRIAIIGVGLGTASAAASSVANFTVEIRQHPPFNQPAIIPLSQPWLDFFLALSISLITGVILSAVTAIILAIAQVKSQPHI